MKPRAFRELERHFNDHAKPFHGLRLNEIRKATVADVLDGIEEKRGPVARNRFRSNLSAFFAWAIAEGFLETNPVEGTAKAAENGPRERVLTPLELAEVWMVLGTDDFSNIVRLLILTGQRREEIGGLRWSEVDLERGLIILPPGRTKNKRQHEVPLSPQASAILGRRKALIEGRAPGVVTLGRDTSLVFGEGQRGFSGWGYSKATLDKRIAKQREAGGAKPMPKWTLHDLRRTAATIMKFGPVSPNEALGSTAVHSIRKGDLVLKKGTVIGVAEVAALKAAGVSEVVVSRLEPGDVTEDEAAAEIARAIGGKGVRFDRAFTGRCNLFADTAGVLVIDKPAVDRLNRIDEAVTLATLPEFKPVVEGEMIATVKIIPFAVASGQRDAALKEAAKAKPVIRIAPYKIRRIGVVSTLLPGLAPKVVEKTLKVMCPAATPPRSKQP